MKILFDTNVILDLMLDRHPFADTAARLISKVETEDVHGFLGAATVTAIFYLASKFAGSDRAKQEVNNLLSIFEIAPVDQAVLQEALKSDFKDFEDAVLHEAAKQAHVQGIVTRNQKDFQNASLPIYGPDELYRIVVSASE